MLIGSSLYSQDLLGPKTVLQNIDNEGPISIFVTDIDGDGKQDILCSSAFDDKISWFKNMDGLGTFSEPRTIIQSDIDIFTISIADLDMDGNIDILASAENNNRCYWIRNLGTNGKFDNPKVINYQINDPIYIETADLDGDNIEDIIISTGTSGQIVWQKNNNDPENRFSEYIVIEDNLSAIFTVKAADLDNDGDQDLVATSFDTDAIYWYENLNNGSSFSNRKTLTVSADGAYDVEMRDYDGDGFLDILATAFFDGNLLLFTNNGNKTFQTPVIINNEYPGITRINSRDFNNDGDVDIALALGSANGLISIANNNGSFNTPEIISRDNLYTIDVASGDIDGDGFLDLVAASYFDDGITWYRNNNLGSFNTSIPVNYSVSNPRKLRHADVDNDGNVDVITLSRDDNKLAWHKNLGGQNGFDQQRIISTDAGEGIDFVAADFNLDGNLDIVSLNTQDSTILCFTQINNLSTSQRIEIDQTDGVPLSIVAKDFNGDGLMDFMIGQESNNKVYWYENQGNFIFSNRKQIATNVDGVQHISADDLDGDGDIDVILPTRNDNTLFWVENLNGFGGFGVKRIIDNDANGIRWTEIGDLDNDGDNDIVASLLESGSIVWYRNFSGSGNFIGPIVLTTGLDGPWSIDLADYDGDGDLDIMGSTFNGSELIFFENLDGNGLMGSLQVIKTDLGLPICIESSDYDNDGDLDLFFASVGSQEFAYFDNWTTNDCIADDFIVEATDCVDGLFDIRINSEYAASNIDYQYYINTNIEGAITNTNAITVPSLNPNTTEQWQVTIINNDETQCDETYIVESPNCDDVCVLSDVVNVSGICNTDGVSYTAVLDFQVDSPLSTTFDLLIDNAYYGNYQYAQIPLELDNLPENFSGSSTITICDNDNDLCCISTEVASPCTCNYINITADIVDCNETREEFYVLLDFTPINNGPNGFIIGGNSTTYGSYTEADLPILIGPLAADDTAYEFLISDAAVNFCFNFIDIGQVDCSNHLECEINNLGLTPLACDSDGLFDLEVQFDAINTTSDSFTIEINGVFNNKYAYGTLPYIVEGLNGDCATLYNVTISDNPSNFCTASASLPNPVCCNIEVCEFTDLEILNIDCTGDGTFNPRISFTGENTNGIQFEIYVDGLLISTNNYGQPSYDLGNLSADCVTMHNIELVDLLDSNCRATIDIEAVCCSEDCGYSNFTVTTQCLPGTDIHTLNFDHPYGDNQTFSLSILNLDMGTYLYGDLPITIGFEIPQNMPIPFAVTDINTNCDFSINMPITCDSECMFTDLQLTYTECEDQLFDLTVSYDIADAVGEEFNLYLNGTNLGVFQYNNTPVLIANLAADCQTIYQVELIDAVDINCSISASLEDAVCCPDLPCVISNLRLTEIECVDENNYSIEIDLDYTADSDQKFELFIDGTLETEQDYAALPLRINNLATGASTSQLTVCDVLTSCCDTLDYNIPECVGMCNLENLVISNFTCDNANSMFNAELDFDWSNSSDSFSVHANNIDIGNYAYLDIPVQLIDMNLAAGAYEFKVTDLIEPNCSISEAIDSIPCLTNSIDIEENEIEIIQVNGRIEILSLSDGETFIADIYDIAGRRILSWKNVSKNNNTYELPHLKAGVYVFALRGKYSVKTQKMLISAY